MRRLLVAALSVVAVACGTMGRADLASAGGVAVTGGFAFAPPTQGEAAAYLTLVNRGTAPDTLLALESPAAAGAMVHRQVRDGDMMAMEHVGALAIPPGDSVAMAPGGLHIMLTSLESVPEPGDSLPLVLRLAHAGELRVTIPVRAYGDEP